MKRIERFKDLGEYRSERARVKGILDHHEANLTAYASLVRDPDFRQGLAWSALNDVIRAWDPMRVLGAVVRSNEGFIENVLMSFLRSRARTFKGRMMAWAAGIILPFVLKKIATAENIKIVTDQVRETWHKMREPDGDDVED